MSESRSRVVTELLAEIRGVGHGRRALIAIDGLETFYRDSYDYPAFIRAVVEPSHAGSAVFPAVWDVDEPSGTWTMMCL